MVNEGPRVTQLSDPESTPTVGTPPAEPRDLLARDHSYLFAAPGSPEEVLLPGKPLKENLFNLWLLAIMGGFLAIICVSSSRFVTPQPGSNWYDENSLSIHLSHSQVDRNTTLTIFPPP